MHLRISWLLVLFASWVVSQTAVAAAQPHDARGPNSLEVTALHPKADAAHVCPDTPLQITFAEAPIVGNGKIQVCDTANDAVVATIDVAVPTLTKDIGGVPNFKYYPVLISKNEVTLTLPEQALEFDKTYYVKMEEGVFKDAKGTASKAIGDAKAWRFSTKSGAEMPIEKAGILRVASDGSGDFATVQAAIDRVPDGNTKDVTIFIRKGVYNEIIVLNEKNAVTLRGEDRKNTIIAYPNNDKFNNNSGGNPFAPGANPSTAKVRGGSIYHRGLFLAHKANDLTIANLTLHNTTPQGGSQAEALILNGSPNAHAVLANLDLISYQDTLQVNGQAYITNCYIEGDVDFMWGRGPCFFENCEAKSLRNNAYYTQIRNPASNHGYVFKHCTFDGAPGISANFLSRIDPKRFANSEVVLIDCLLTNAVGQVGWKLDGGAKDAPDVHFWEYNSHDADGKPIDVSKRLAASRQLALPADQETIDHYSDAQWVLGGDWTPKLPQP